MKFLKKIYRLTVYPRSPEFIFQPYTVDFDNYDAAFKAYQSYDNALLLDFSKAYDVWGPSTINLVELSYAELKMLEDEYEKC